MNLVLPALCVVMISGIAAIPLRPSVAEGQQGSGPVLRSIKTTRSDNTSIVSIEATQGLPVPEAGVVDGPPRIYLDFPGVTPGTAGVAVQADPLIRRVRVALNNAAPLVTRVVIDLVERAPYRLERDPNAANVLRVIVGTAPERHAAPSPIPPVSQLPDPVRTTAPAPKPAPTAVARTVPPPTAPPPAPLSTTPTEIPPTLNAPALPPTVPASPRSAAATSATRAPAQSDAAAKRGSPKDVEKYQRQIASALLRLNQQRRILASIDANASEPAEELQTALENLEGIRKTLMGVAPPEALRPVHDLLIQSSTFGAMAARLRLEALRTNDDAAMKNAESAAAGAIMLLERACADIGCPEQGPIDR
jgi:AMIN domain